MTTSLVERIRGVVAQTLRAYPGAWLTWCDPRGDWLPVLQKAASDGSFNLVNVTTSTSGEVGDPLTRREIVAKMEAKESFVLRVPAAPTKLGWLWALTLQAERTYTMTLREQLTQWGWRPHSLTVTDEQIAALAVQNADHDPSDWGGANLQPDVPLLLDALAAGEEPGEGKQQVFDATVDMAGLPPLDERGVARWRLDCLAALLVTQAHHVAPEFVPANHSLLIAIDRREFALNILQRWADSKRMHKGLPEAIIETDKLTGLGSCFATATAASGPFLSLAAESAVFATTCQKLANLTPDDIIRSVAEIEKDVRRHADSYWGGDFEHPRAVPWADLLRLSQAARAILDCEVQGSWSQPREGIAWYIDRGWRMEQAGEEINRTLARTTPDLLELIRILREAYRARRETYAINWSNLWKAAGYPDCELPTAGEWLSEVLREMRPTAIVYVDALRYDLGVALADSINQVEGSERAQVSPACSPLPTTTAIGMAAALPVKRNELMGEVVDGKWRISQRETNADLSTASARRAWLQSKLGIDESCFYKVSEVLAGNVQAPTRERSRVVVSDDALDKLGHDDQLDEHNRVSLDRYVSVARRLMDAGYRRVLFVTDHGYLQWHNGGERETPLPAPDPVYLCRRAAAYPLNAELEAPHIFAPGEKYIITVPGGVASYKAYGTLGYFHGGGSLQEMIIPCLKVEHPTEAKPVGVEFKHDERILSLQPRLTLHVIKSDLFGEDALPREVDIIIREKKTRKILFRSERVTVKPDRSEVQVNLKAEEGVVAQRGTELCIEMRDKDTDDVIVSADGKLLIEMSGW